MKTQLGHRSINSTLRYVSTTDKQASQAITVADEVFDGLERRAARTIRDKTPRDRIEWTKDHSTCSMPIGNARAMERPDVQKELFQFDRRQGWKPESLRDKAHAREVRRMADNCSPGRPDVE